MTVNKKVALPASVQRQAGPTSALRAGTVKLVSSAGLTVTVAGADVPGLSYLSSYDAPRVGDVVSLYAQDSSWLVLGPAVKQVGQWFTTSPTNGFTVNGSVPISYRLLANGDVQVYGKVQSGASTGSGTSWATLPAGFYNPNVAITQNMANISALTPLWVDLSTGGQLQTHGVWANGNVLLLNATFPITVA